MIGQVLFAYGILLKKSKPLSLLLEFSLNLNQVPSQVIYTSSFLLSACWLPSLNAFALGNADGDISLYRISYSQPSALYHNGSIQAYYDSNEYSCNGLFDSAMKEPFISSFLYHV